MMEEYKGPVKEVTRKENDDITTPEPNHEEKSSSTKALAISKHMIPSKTVFALAGAVAGSFYPYINHGHLKDDLTTAEPDHEEKSSPTKALAISKHMIPSKIVFALAGAVAGSFYPYINVFLTSIGLTVSAAGFIGGIRFVSSSIVGPLWGILIDYTGQRKFIYTLLCLGTGFTIFSLPWAAQSIIISSNETITKQNHSTNNIFNPGYDPGYNLNETQYDSTTKHGFTSKLFYVMLISILASNLFDLPLQGLIDSFVMNVVQSNKEKSSFGMQKMYHSVSFGAANFLAGVAADQLKLPKTMSKYTAIFYVFLPSIIFLIPAGLFLLRQTKWKPAMDEDHKKKTEKEENRFRLLQKTLKNLDYILFLFSVCLVGVASAVLLGFLFMLMDQDMHASKSCMGLSVLISCLVQVSLFPSSHRIIKRIGPIVCIELALITYSIRFMLVSHITNPYLILPTQLFHCVGFALFWAASVEHIQMTSPKEIYCTMYGVLNSVYWGLGGMIGNMLGGLIYTQCGGRLLFRGTAVMCAVWACVMIVYFHLFKRLNEIKKQSTVNPRISAALE